MEKEIWKDISGYEGLYQVSNLGNVRMLEHYTPYVKGTVMKIPARNLYIGWSNGYRTVWLCKNKERKLKKIHRLIAEAFIPNPENKPCIDHINTIRHDNRIENLRWCTYKENGNNEITKKNLSNSQKGKPKKSLQKTVVKLSKNGYFIKEYSSMSDASIDISGTNELVSRIGLCCRGIRKTAGGYKWKYKEDYNSMNYLCIDHNSSNVIGSDIVNSKEVFAFINKREGIIRFVNFQTGGTTPAPTSVASK